MSSSSQKTPGPPDALELTSSSENQTHTLGVRLASLLHGGELIGLRGDLGCGKTVFVRGLAEGLGIAAAKVRSPSFTLINEYSGGRLPLYHMDLYRVQLSDVDRMALREYLYGSGVCVVEWIERLGEEAPALEISFTVVGESRRHLVVSAHGASYVALLECLRAG